MSKDRHAMVEITCEVCGEKKTARRERVDQGMGRFCSKKCFDVEQRNRRRGFWGRKDLAKRYKVGERYCARWHDKNGKAKSTSYAKWWWEMNVGEIPRGMIILHIDNNPLNINPSNFKLGTKSDALRKGNATRKADKKGWEKYIEKLRKKQTGFRHTDESKKKIASVHKGRKLSSEHLEKLRRATEKLWKDGIFDKVHKGKYNSQWRGGVEKKYPPEYSKELRNFIRSRDGFQCQICSASLNGERSGHVHHINGDRGNNSQDNLILLCVQCHGKVHSKGKQSPPIMALRSELHWSK